MIKVEMPKAFEKSRAEQKNYSFFCRDGVSSPIHWQSYEKNLKPARANCPPVQFFTLLPLLFVRFTTRPPLLAAKLTDFQPKITNFQPPSTQETAAGTPFRMFWRRYIVWRLRCSFTYVIILRSFVDVVSEQAVLALFGGCNVDALQRRDGYQVVGIARKVVDALDGADAAVGRH